MCKVEFGVRIDDDLFKVTPTLFDLGRQIYESVALIRDKNTNDITIVGEIFTERKEENEK